MAIMRIDLDTDDEGVPYFLVYVKDQKEIVAMMRVRALTVTDEVLVLITETKGRPEGEPTGGNC